MSISGRVFYIGCTSNPINRYKDHYKDWFSACYKLCRYWLHEKSVAAVMTIISEHDNKQDGFKAESNRIIQYSNQNPLLNHQFYPRLFTTPIPDVKNIKILKNTLIINELNNIKKQLDESNKIRENKQITC